MQCQEKYCPPDLGKYSEKGFEALTLLFQHCIKGKLEEKLLFSHLVPVCNHIYHFIPLR